ncbi:MAG: hypothetical protein ACRDSF_15725 [Pseudonocardiaceae bacterium]
MGTLSPLLTDALGLLREDLCIHLEEADCLANQAGEWSGDDIQTARGLIGDLVLVLRGLLVEHQLRPSGDCRICGAAWPCPVVTTIHAFVKDPHRQFVALVTRSQDDE